MSNMAALPTAFPEAEDDHCLPEKQDPVPTTRCYPRPQHIACWVPGSFLLLAQCQPFVERTNTDPSDQALCSCPWLPHPQAQPHWALGPPAGPGEGERGAPGLSQAC